MPYKDPEKRKEAVRRYRARKRAEREEWAREEMTREPAPPAFEDTPASTSARGLWWFMVGVVGMFALTVLGVRKGPG